MSFHESLYSTVSAAAINLHIVIVGQSFVTQFNVTSFYKGFVQTLMDLGYGPKIFMNSHDYNGASTLFAHKRADVTVVDWCFTEGPSGGNSGLDMAHYSNGDLLDDAVFGALPKLDATLPGKPTPTCLIALQGQQDTVARVAGDGTDQQYCFAFWYWTRELAKKWNPGNPGGVRKIPDLEGRRNSNDEPFWRALIESRDSKIAFLNARSEFLPWLEFYDAPLHPNDDHFQDPWGFNPGVRMAWIYDNEFGSGSSHPIGPQVTALTRIAPNVIRVTITVETGCDIEEPATPWAWKAIAGTSVVSGANIPITGYAWQPAVGNQRYLDLTLASAGQCTIAYPVAQNVTFTIDGKEPSQFIRYKPLFSGDAGIPLRSMLSTTVAA